MTPSLAAVLRRSRRLGLVSVLATALLCSTSGPSAAAQSPEAPSAASRKPTIVLVHGAWEDGSSWAGVAHRLSQLGYPVRVPPVALHSLADDATALSQFVDTVDGPVVLVGHSYGGAVISNMPVDPDVRALVFVDAFAPAEGEELATLPGPDSALAVADPTTIFDFKPYAGGPDGDVEIYLKQDFFRTSFANDLPARRAELLWAMQRPITFSALHTPSATPAWLSVPSWFALGVHDRIIPPAAQKAMAQRANSTIREVRAGHLSHVSRPAAVTAVIVEAEQAVER